VIVSLASMREGKTGAVRVIDGGEAVRHRLADMGITMGTRLKVVRGRGPMIVEVRGHRLVLGHGMVEKVQVEPDG
jgi:ferrous iron transport protein A